MRLFFALLGVALLSAVGYSQQHPGVSNPAPTPQAARGSSNQDLPPLPEGYAFPDQPSNPPSATMPWEDYAKSPTPRNAATQPKPKGDIFDAINPGQPRKPQKAKARSVAPDDKKPCSVFSMPDPRSIEQKRSYMQGLADGELAAFLDQVRRCIGPSAAGYRAAQAFVVASDESIARLLKQSDQNYENYYQSYQYQAKELRELAAKYNALVDDYNRSRDDALRIMMMNDQLVGFLSRENSQQNATIRSLMDSRQTVAPSPPRTQINCHSSVVKSGDVGFLNTSCD